jgi:TolA-binding protein
MRVCIAISLLLLCATFAASQSPKTIQAQTLEQKMQKMEKAMAKMAANHHKTMARLKQVEDQIDGLTSAIHEMRLQLEKK